MPIVKLGDYVMEVFDDGRSRVLDGDGLFALRSFMNVHIKRQVEFHRGCKRFKNDWLELYLWIGMRRKKLHKVMWVKIDGKKVPPGVLKRYLVFDN